MAGIGRNAPCPCGSGKKYKKCCIDKGAQGSRFMDGLREGMESQTFGSLEEAQAFADLTVAQQNSAPGEDFHGLSPDQMHELLWSPFDSPDLVTFFDAVFQADGPLPFLFNAMAAAIDEKGLKGTAKGNLPQKLCREVEAAYYDEVIGDPTRFRTKVNGEEDFQDLHVVRLVAEMAGLVTHEKGRFFLSPLYQECMAKGGFDSVYPLLLRVYMESFNWGFNDGYPDLDIIRQSSTFALYLLGLYGDEMRDESFYETCFITAFPAVLQQVSPGEPTDPETTVRHAYSLRTFLRFAWFLGLVALEEKDAQSIRPEYRVKALTQLQQAVSFHLG